MNATKTRVVVGSTAGRGPCEACGLIAELHPALEILRCAPEFVLAIRDLCLPCCTGEFAVAPLPDLSLRAA